MILSVAANIFPNAFTRFLSDSSLLEPDCTGSSFLLLGRNCGKIGTSFGECVKVVFIRRLTKGVANGFGPGILEEFGFCLLVALPYVRI